jgi:hypothetical protein
MYYTCARTLSLLDAGLMLLVAAYQFIKARGRRHGGYSTAAGRSRGGGMFGPIGSRESAYAAALEGRDMQHKVRKGAEERMGREKRARGDAVCGQGGEGERVRETVESCGFHGTYLPLSFSPLRALVFTPLFPCTCSPLPPIRVRPPECLHVSCHATGSPHGACERPTRRPRPPAQPHHRGERGAGG